MEQKNEKGVSAWLSNKITRLMFWMSLLVVYIHVYDAQFKEPAFYAVNVLQDIISQGFCRVAVPVFFMISGYLHFTRKELSEKTLLYAFRRKVSTLIVPYFLWNVFYLLYQICLRFMLGTASSTVNVSFVLKGIFLYGCIGAFWYVFQLILLNALSPLLLKLFFKKTVAIAFVGVVFIMYLLIDKNTKLFLLTGILFFSIGAIAAIHFTTAIDCSCWTPKKKSIVSAIAVVSLVTMMVWRFLLMDLSVNISILRSTVPYRIFEFLAAIAFWYAVDIVRIGEQKAKWFERDSFFVFASHGFVLSVANVIIKHVMPMTPFSRTIVYLLLPLITVMCILAISSLLKKMVPNFYKLISGGR